MISLLAGTTLGLLIGAMLSAGGRSDAEMHAAYDRERLDQAFRDCDQGECDDQY